MPKDIDKGSLLIITESPLDALWEQLSSIESYAIAEQLISKRASDAGIEIEKLKLETKANSLSYCIRNAREYLRLSAGTLTIAATANYYGCLWLAAAVAVSDPETDADLTSIEQATKFGHGLGNFSERGAFPGNELIYVKSKGFLNRFLEWTGVPVDVISKLSWSGSGPEAGKAISPEKQSLLIPLADLFSRIPELTQTFEDVTGKDAKNFELFHAANGLQGLPPFDQTSSMIGVHGEYSKEHLIACKLPLEDLREYQNSRGHYANAKWAGRYSQPDFFSHVYRNPQDKRLYISPLRNYYFISPLFESISNPLAVHLMLSYQLSILARYRPAVWREVLEGSLDQYRILIAAYQGILIRVVPHLVLNTIIGRRIRLSLPGAFV